MSRAHAANGSFLISQERLGIYDWLRREATPESTVCCLDIGDMQLHLVYGGGQGFIGGAEWLQAPNVALRRYFQSLTRCGIPHQMVLEWVTSYFLNKPDYHLFPAVPKGDKKAVEGVLFLNHILYQPYVKTFNGTPMMNESGGWNPAFLDCVNALSKETSEIEVADAMPDFIFVSAQMQKHRQNDEPPTGYVEATRHGTHVVYRRQEAV